jgi:hypothetical protein
VTLDARAGGNSPQEIFIVMSKHFVSLSLLAAVTLAACDRSPISVDRLAGTDADPSAMIIGPGGPSGPERPGGDPPQPNSPHWTHARFAATAWHIVPGSPAVEWMARHFDAFMSGPLDEIRGYNPTALHMPYAMIIHVPTPGHQYTPSLEIMYQEDMRAWYDDPARNTGGWQFEDAFLHSQYPRTPENRLLTPVDPSNPWNNIPWYAMNVGDAGFRAYTVDRFRRLLGLYPGGANWNSVFIDVAGVEIGWGYGSVEYATHEALNNAYIGLYQAIRPALGGLPFFLNVSSYHTSQYPFLLPLVHAAGGAHQEFILYAASEWGQVVPVIERYLNETTAIIMPTSNQRGGDYDFLGAGNHLPVNNLSAPLSRGYMVELAQYYMAMPMDGPQRLYLSPGSPGPGGWYPPYQRNVGTPTAPRMLYASGPDGAGQWGAVYARPFSNNALVLIRPVPGWTPHPNHTDASAMAVTLPPGNWHRVLDNNVLDGRASRSVQLRLAEAAIFVRVN